MNNLNRPIMPGEEIVIKANFLLPAFQELEKRVFIVSGGPGLSNRTSGSRIYGRFKDGESDTVRGWEISVEETLAWRHREHGVGKFDGSCSMCLAKTSKGDTE